MASKKIEGALKPAAKGRGGVRVSHHKNTCTLEVVRMPAPERVILPMQQHIGAPCIPTVKVGDEVKIGDVVGDTDAFVSAPIHATVSGKVVAVGPVKVADGSMIPAVTIESDGKMTDADFKVPKVNSREDFLKAVRASGLVGLGGAGFPTHVKLAFKEDAGVDTLIINAAECEPFITVDHRECIDNSWDVLSGIYTVKEILGFKNVFIAIEDNKCDAFEILQKIASNNADWDDSVKLVILKSRYPQGAEKVLIESVTGKRVPPGKLPSDVGVVVMNVASISFLGRYLKTGKPLVSRSLTVDGSAIKEPKNLRVPIGTEVSKIIEFCGGFSSEPYKIISGGPMMGIALCDIDVPILKSNNAILAFSKDQVRIKKERDCIRCGRCAEACPLNLMPSKIEIRAALGDAEGCEALHATTCMECGSCAYACPSGKPLVQHMRLAKAVILANAVNREESEK
ncbi:MAG: electron transport complex subunit RsxC [Ruminococcaceae bacterium]|nr:electron transport complex subunit RsxC [Oscillospiraceae bacterium]